MWWWALLWFVLLVGAGLVIGLLAKMLWGKVKALTAEMHEASGRLTAVLSALNDRAADQAGDPGGSEDHRSARRR